MGYINKDDYSFLANSIKCDTMAGRIKLLRYERGLTLVQASVESGISKTSLCSWENGKVEPGAFGLICLSDFYKVSVDYLLTGKKSEYER